MASLLAPYGSQAALTIARDLDKRIRMLETAAVTDARLEILT